MQKVLVAVAVTVFVAGGCASSGASGEVTMEGISFEPQDITVQAGETVSWVNGGGDAHTVTAYEEELPEGVSFFASGDASGEEAARDELSAGLIQDGESFEVTFDEAGRYRYFCIPHESSGMTGTVVVQEG